MSQGKAVVQDQAIHVESPPRILRDIQDVTSKLLQEFSSTGEPVTDDNHVLHRFCVKLEYFLQTCMREKTILSGAKHYWHWMYDSLKRTRRLSDGLKFVCANKEVRTSQGRGRALIRYSLVHQTLADSFQNCLMNQSTCTHYLKSTCILMNSRSVALFLNALYEFNAVHFDLTSKGYDLDNAWPTFASKRNFPGIDQWRLPPGRTTSVGSLGSYISHMTSVSMMHENPNLRGVRSASGVMDYDGRGTVSSGPPSVDQRVEELVLELNESDHKMQEQEQVLKRLETEANTAAKSATEEKEILAGLVSDLQSKNQSLQGAMSQMSTECQNREQAWESKYNELHALQRETEETNASLKSRITVLEEDKRNLEDTVSARMSLITSGFSGTSMNSISPSPSMDDFKYKSEDREAALQQKLVDSENERKILGEKVDSLRRELSAVPSRLEAEKKALASSLTAKFETEEMEWKRKVDVALETATGSVLSHIVNALPPGYLASVMEVQTTHERIDSLTTRLMETISEVTKLRRTSVKLQEEKLAQRSFDEERESEADELIAKLSAMQDERDNALDDMKNSNQQLVDVSEELQKFKLRHEAEISDRQRDMVDLKDANFHLLEDVKKEKYTNKELDVGIRLLRQRNDDMALDLKFHKQRCMDLQEQLNERDKQLNKIKKLDAAAMQTTIEDLQAKITHLENEAVEEGKLQDSCIEENERLENIIAELKEEVTKSKGFGEALREEINARVHATEILEAEKNALATELSHEKAKAADGLQQSADISIVLTNATEAFKNTEKQYKMLNENLAGKEIASADVHMNAMKACIETERSIAKKEYEELSGENESRKRMVKSLEEKMKTLEGENKKLSKSVTDVKDLENRLALTQEERDESARLSNDTEQELVKMAEKLEQEREDSLKLKNEVSESLAREYDLKREVEDLHSISDDMKEKLVQLLHEKDALWKECDELKYFQTLQEGGEGIEAKWMEDQAARYCLHCGTEFTFIVRKHHCRLCGKIFCNDCSKQWIITKADGKHERCCISCLERHRNEKEIQSLAAATPSPSGSGRHSSQLKGNRLFVDDTGFETITDEELNESRLEDSLKTPSSEAQSSLYFTPSFGDHSSQSISSIPDDKENAFVTTLGKEREITVAAGDVAKIPVNIVKPGTALTWRFSTDRSIDFQLYYSATKDGEEEHALIPRCRCNSHTEPVQGEIVTKEAGFYMFEFDNRFSRYVSKAVKYSLKLKNPDE